MLRMGVIFLNEAPPSQPFAPSSTVKQSTMAPDLSQIHGIDDMANESLPSGSDVWCSDNDEDVSGISETVKVRRAHHKEGYIEGVTQTKEHYLQEGFNSEYPTGAHIGAQVGEILGSFQGLGLRDLENAASRDLSPDSLFSELYYNAMAEKIYEGTSHPLIIKWQNILAPYLA